MALTSVLLVDDDAMVRTGLRIVLGADPGLSIAGEAVNGAEAVTAVRDLRPDVVLMDLQMPVMDGVEATRQICAVPDAPSVLVLTTFHLDSYVLDAIDAGASGYLLKDTAPLELARSVQVVAHGGAVFSPEITRNLVRQLKNQEADEAASSAHARLAGLTEREREVAQALAEGHSNATIAAKLYMGEATVKTHVSRILMKTGTENRVQIAILVYEAGRG